MALRFDPDKSRVSKCTKTEFIDGTIEEDILSVPGVGDAAAARLAKRGVNNTYQFIGVYLGLRENDMDSVAHHDAFVNFLNKAGITNCRHGIVDAIAQKVSTMIPGLYDIEAIRASLDEHK
mmetsp:Transcript_12238/g.18321  ORF Transcript_12238/g.18321 Transcript_12238/m.18321 type:complete len:121 (+) Transcript_12238:104-466(+)